MTTKRPPREITDAEVDALLVALHRDVADTEPASDADAPEGEGDDEEAYLRFLQRAVVKNAGTGEYMLAREDTRGVGEFVRAFRGNDAPSTFASRFGLSSLQLAGLEACVVELRMGELDTVAKRVATELSLPGLKVLRLLKAAAAKVSAPESGPLLLLAARARPGRDRA